MATAKTTPLRVNELTKEDVAKMSDADKARVKNSLTSTALTRLKERHPEEFEVIATELFEGLGLTRVRRLSPEERKRKDLEALAAELGVTIQE